MQQFSVLVWQEKNAFVSKLEGTNISSYGGTVEEAIESLKEAVELYFENMAEDEKQEVLESAEPFDDRENTYPLSIH
ncbi:type II toxin-antitoxin system HicB family antitoxin [Candidatus Mycalebacterium sp.]